jgi:hypothetical protein
MTGKLASKEGEVMKRAAFIAVIVLVLYTTFAYSEGYLSIKANVVTTSDSYGGPLWIAGGGAATTRSVVISSSSFFNGTPGAAIEVYEDDSGQSRISFGIKNPETGQIEQVGYFDNDGFHGKVAQ